MRFWDASAILPLLVEETATAVMTALLREDAACYVCIRCVPLTLCNCLLPLSRLNTILKL